MIFENLINVSTSGEIARLAAIGQMSGCLTTESGRPYSGVVGG